MNDGFPIPSLRLTDPTSFQDKSPPEREWIVPNWIPVGVVTGLYGPGGAGKTLLVQQLMTATALGKPWLGLEVMPAKSLAVFCEDDDDELQRRQNFINRFYECEFRDIGDVRWTARLGEDNLLMKFDNRGPRTLTDFWRELRKIARQFGARLLIVDTVADTFGGNQNDAGQTRQYVQMALGQLARDINGAVVACAHPSQSGQNSGSGTSGSVQWDAAFRSRLYLSNLNPSGSDPNSRILSRKKANYAPRDDQIDLVWRNGVLVPKRFDPKPKPERSPEAVFLAMLDSVRTEERHVSYSNHASNYAPKVFAAREHPEGYDLRTFSQAMERLFQKKAIRVATYKTPNRHDAEEIVRVEAKQPD